MEDISAAKALAWYRELDRDFRSSKTGAQCESVLNLAPRLLQWSLEVPVNEAAVDLFKLDPGQEHAYANAIFLRLGETFKNGNNILRFCVLKVLLFVHKQGDRSLLSKERITDGIEMLKRVKSVAGSTDVAARCLALCALGCLAQLDGESVELHRLVLDSMESKHEQEVEAAYFAAGCLCEISLPFAASCCKKISELSMSIHTPTRLRVGAIHLFSRMWLSTSIATEAYKTGKDLMLKLPSEDVVTTTLASLSNLVMKSKSLLPEHVNLLMEYIRSDPRASVRMISLVSCSKLLSRCYLEVDLSPVRNILEDMDFAPGIRVEGLRVLQKVSPAYIRDLIPLLELNAMDADWSISYQALLLLVELCRKTDHILHGIDLSTRTILLLCDRLTLLTSIKEALIKDFRHLILRLVTHSARCCHLLVKYLSNAIEVVVSKDKMEVENAIADDDAKKVAMLCRFLHICSTHSDLEDSLTRGRIEHVLQILSQVEAFDEAYLNLLPGYSNIIDEASDGVFSKIQKIADGFMQSFKFWDAYKLAKLCCCCGLWTISESIFIRIASEATSESCYFWLKALSQVSAAGNIISSSRSSRKYLEAGSLSLPLLEKSIITLQAGVHSERTYEFQQQYLRLRIQLMQLMMDLIALCSSVQKRISQDGPKAFSSFSGKARMLVSKLQDLAEDFFIVTTLFMRIDECSLRLLYTLMYECSLLGFTTAFAFLPVASSATSASEYSTCYRTDVLVEVQRCIESCTTDGNAMFEEFLLMLGRISVGRLIYKGSTLSKTEQTHTIVTSVWKQLLESKCGVDWSTTQRIIFLKNIVERLFHLKWILPKFFFNTMPHTQLEISHCGGRAADKKDIITITENCNLSLKLGLKISNLPANIKLEKCLCILAVMSNESSFSRQNYNNTPDTHRTYTLLKWLAVRSRLSENRTLFSFIPDIKNQGFYSCTLDTACLPPGMYEISCLSVCTDSQGHKWKLSAGYNPKLRVISAKQQPI